jgi:hypothetical protein
MMRKTREVIYQFYKNTATSKLRLPLQQVWQEGSFSRQSTTRRLEGTYADTSPTSPAIRILLKLLATLTLVRKVTPSMRNASWG